MYKKKSLGLDCKTPRISFVKLLYALLVTIYMPIVLPVCINCHIVNTSLNDIPGSRRVWYSVQTSSVQVKSPICHVPENKCVIDQQEAKRLHLYDWIYLINKLCSHFSIIMQISSIKVFFFLHKHTHQKEWEYLFKSIRKSIFLTTS